MTKIRIYSLSTCAWCKKLKNYLDQHSVAYECIDVDIAEPAVQKASLKEVDQLAEARVFPITVVRGKTIVGFQPERIMEALNDEA